MRLQSNKRPGQLPVLIAVALVAILAFVALALEGGILLNQRRHAQVAAESAALAAAAKLFDYMNNNGDGYWDPATKQALSGSAIRELKSKAITAAQDYAAANGYQHVEGGDESTVQVEVHIPPTMGSSKDKEPGYAEVIITAPQRRRFSSIFGRDDFHVKARAVACAAWRPIPYAIIVLDPKNKGSFTAKGQGNVTVTGAGVIVDSNNSTGGLTTGGGIVIAPTFDFTGTPGYSGNFQGKINGGQPVMPDPLATLPVPTSPNAPPLPPPPPEQSTAVTSPELTVVSTKKMTISGSTSVTLNPGIYQGGISITTQGTVTLKSGIYYMDGGGFSMTGGGSLIGEDAGVMIYNAPRKNNDVINIAGQGSVVLSPFKEGSPNYVNWPGILLFQDRTSTAEVSITGGGNYDISGTFYAASANLKVTGNGVAKIGSQYVSYTLTTDGSGTLQIPWTPNATGRTLYFGLVE